jgi:hypothetical protein
MPKTMNPYPGKYEGNHSQWLAEIVHHASMDGCDEEFGDVCDYGFWAGVLHGKRYNFYLTEDSQGFVTVFYAKVGDILDFDYSESFLADQDDYIKWEESNV